MNWLPNVVTMGVREQMVKPATEGLCRFFLACTSSHDKEVTLNMGE